MKVTDHAPLRYLQRVDPTEAFPRERVRAMYDRARRVHRDDVEGEAYRDPETGAVLVVDELADVVVTVLDGEPA